MASKLVACCEIESSRINPHVQVQLVSLFFYYFLPAAGWGINVLQELEQLLIELHIWADGEVSAIPIVST